MCNATLWLCISALGPGRQQEETYMYVTYSRYTHVEVRGLRLSEVMKSISHKLYFKIIEINRIEFNEHDYYWD